MDIDPGAVEIAKLRLWLSLIVDEDDIQNIKPLPNLDYKIVCGNSLIGVEKNLFNVHLFAELESLKPLFFNATNPTKKHEYKKKIDGLIDQVTDGRLQFDFDIYFSEVFHDRNGFDVVIGNPPYGMLQPHNTGKNTLDFFNANYQVASFKIDMFHLFIERSINILKSSGNLVLIIPNTFITNVYTQKLRDFITSKCKILQIIVSSEIMFEAAERNNAIINFQKDERSATRSGNEISIILDANVEFLAGASSNACIHSLRQSDLVFLSSGSWNIKLSDNSSPFD